MKQMKSYSMPNHTWYNETEFNVLYMNELDPLICDGEHDWETTLQGDCYIRKLCLKCGAMYERDSSD